MFNFKDVFADTWVSIDDEGRVTGFDNGVVKDRKVGIFYFLWHDRINHPGDGKIYNHSLAYKQGGSDALIEELQKGPLGFAHYWAEPYFGYYNSDDEWVIRKHAYQLTSAGIDFVFFDTTNGLIYEHNLETVLTVWSKMRTEGYKTPDIMFNCGNPTYDEMNPSASPAYKSVMALWKSIYSVGRFKDMWYMHDGKPIILVPDETWKNVPDDIRAFFTRRQSWANSSDSWYSESEGRNCWPWADLYPQGAGKAPDGKVEQMIVMSGFWVNGGYGTNAGRSFHNGKQPDNKTKNDFGFSLVDESSGKGYAFEEQFDYAISQDPGMIMITGWNEWWAGRGEAGPAVGQTIANTYKVTDDDKWTRHYYVDAFNPEFSRDIEPVKGYYNDNYYYQMAQNIRQYKGSRTALAAFGQRPIDMSAPESQWDIVGPEYRDYVGDTAARDSMSYVGQIHYTNDSGRNDFEVCKVSKNGNDLFFYARCAEDITAPEGTNWMNLFIDVDCNAGTGWYGYDYVLNRTRDGNTCSVMKFIDNGWQTEQVGSAEYSVSGKYIQIKVDSSLLGIGETFAFKWADNAVDDGDIMKFLDIGDTAPNDRFNYRYTTAETEIEIPSVLSDDMTVLKAGSYNAFANGKMVMLDSSSTKAVFAGDKDGMYVPKAFAAEVIGLDVGECKVFNHYGMDYVNIAELLKSCGKTVTYSESLLSLIHI